MFRFRVRGRERDKICIPQNQHVQLIYGPKESRDVSQGRRSQIIKGEEKEPRRGRRSGERVRKQRVIPTVKFGQKATIEPRQ